MSGRKVAKDQPESFQWTPENLAWCDKQIAKYPEGRQASAVIPMLWQGQKQDGWCSVPMMEAIAKQLGMPYIRVLEVATFYTMFYLEPVGEFHVQLCGTTPCMLRGAEDLKEVCREKIGPNGSVSDDGKLSWIEVECLGACSNAPMVQVNDYFYEDLTAESFSKLLEEFRAGQNPEPGNYMPRKCAAPISGPTTLTDPALFDGSRAQPIAELPSSKPVEEAPAEG